MFLLLISLLTTLPPPAAAYTAAEAEALLKFRSRLSAETLSSWGTIGNCCEWVGIRCENLTVSEITLPGKNISRGGGGLSSALQSLSQLRGLRRLDLSGNNFSGELLPGSISAAAGLTHLNLSLCVLAGAVPSSLSNLSSLRSLDLSYNLGLRSGDLLWLAPLASLGVLDLSYVDLSLSSSWHLSLSNLSSLTSLSLSWCSLSSPAGSPPANRPPPPPLRSLALSINNLDSSILDWVYSFKGTLVDLDLSYNNIARLPARAGDLCRLREMRLAGNNMTQEISEVFMALSGCAERGLAFLDLDDNNIGGSIPDLEKFSALESLHISRNSLSKPIRGDLLLPGGLSVLDLGHNAIPGPLPDPAVFSSVTELYLGSNQIDGPIGPGIANLSRAVVIDLSYNSLESTLTESHLSGLGRLRHFDISGNRLGVRTAPGWAPPFRLAIIGLRGCRIGPGFPGWLSAQANYSVLDASASGISGPVPASFWRLSAVFGYLNLSHNQLAGAVPAIGPGLGPIIDLSGNDFDGPVPLPPPGTTSFAVSGNRFSGPVGPALCSGRLASAGNIDLSENRLAGEIPDCFAGMASLSLLRLDGNRLTGRVPPSLGSLSLLQSLHLQNNILTGQFPSGIKGCPKLKVLDLSRNNFSGPIPGWLGGALADLIVLNLRENRLEGAIPEAVCEMSGLRVLDASRNVLSGPIPKCLSNLTAMAEVGSGDGSTVEIDLMVSYYDFLKQEAYSGYIDSEEMVWKGTELRYKSTLGLVRAIDLSGNRLTGSIPSGITALVELIGLNLSRNGLSGPIPGDLGRLRALDSLDLSRNRLTGEIPKSLGGVQGLGTLDLSENELSGKIPESTQLQSFDVSAFAGNPGLCGPPLAVKCRGDEGNGSGRNDPGRAGSTGTGFGLGFGFGFGVGFWCVCGPLLFFPSLRRRYFWVLRSLSSKIRDG